MIGREAEPKSLALLLRTQSVSNISPTAFLFECFGLLEMVYLVMRG